ncbi:MAG TPA: hypothetical protein VHC00_06655 [Rhizobiaceae bacterium]|nr:hypothetical protein [Rhizobiaceae bacterium]
MTDYRQRFTKIGLIGIAFFLLGPLVALAGALIEFANDPFLSNTPILGFILMAVGSAATYLSLPLLLIGRVYVPGLK